MFRWASKLQSMDVCAILPVAKPLSVRARVSENKVVVVSAQQHGDNDSRVLKSWSGCEKSFLMLPPELYASAILPAPAGALDTAQISDSLRWAFAKDAEIDMASSEWEVLRVPDIESGGAMLKEHYWIFAIERAALKRMLEPLVKAKVKIGAVDVLPMAQRNLCWAEARSNPDRPGAYASLVMGESYSALGIVSLDGDLLFHKQMEWTESALRREETREKLVLDMQRNIGYFERRLSALGLVHGYVYGKDSSAIAEHLKSALGGFEWTPGVYPGVDWSLAKIDPGNVSGDWSWLVGALWRLG